MRSPSSDWTTRQPQRSWVARMTKRPGSPCPKFGGTYPAPTSVATSYDGGHWVHWIQHKLSVREPDSIIPVTASVDDDGVVLLEGYDSGNVYNDREDCEGVCGVAVKICPAPAVRCLRRTERSLHVLCGIKLRRVGRVPTCPIQTDVTLLIDIGVGQGVRRFIGAFSPSACISSALTITAALSASCGWLHSRSEAS
jgi:hypothetical protein